MTPEQHCPGTGRLLRLFGDIRMHSRFAAFHYQPHAPFDALVHAERLTPGDVDRLTLVVTHPVLRTALADLMIPEVLPKPSAALGWDPADLEAIPMEQHPTALGTSLGVQRLTVAGLRRHLAGTFLEQGGLDGPYPGDKGPLHAAIDAFMTAVTGPDTLNPCFTTDVPWTPWFSVLNRTWIGVNGDRRLIWLLCATAIEDEESWPDGPTRKRDADA